LIILGLMAGMFLLLASGFVNTRHAWKQSDELRTVYEAIVGDPNGSTFGYLGDVGTYPGTLNDLISPSPLPPGWNGPYLRTARIKHGVQNPALPDYESLGKVSFNIQDFDENAPKNGFVAGCPGLYDIVISSVPREANETYITYNPGTAVVDLVQGQYLVKVFVSGSHFAVWQEQLTVKPGSALVRNLNLPGVNSHLFEAVTLTLVNHYGSGLAVQENGTEVGGNIKNGATVTRTLDRCARIEVKNDSTKSAVDAFTMPYGNLTRRYRGTERAPLSLTVANEGPAKTLAIYSDGLLAGTVSGRGVRRLKTFALPSDAVITVKNENDTLLDTFPLVAGTTKNY